MIASVRRHPLFAFVVLAYLGSWAMWSPWWLSGSGLGILPYDLPFTAIAGINQLGLFAGPFAAAPLVTRITDGPGGIPRLLRGFVQWRARPLGYVLALVLVPAATALGYFVLPGTTVALDAGAAAVLGTLVVTYLTYLLGGPVQEEPGWRDFALPRLQARMAPVPAALVLGVVHCVWHALLFLTDEWDTARHEPSQFLAYLVLVLGLSVALSWIFNASNGSLLLVVLGHNGLNWALFAAGTVTGGPVTNTWPAAIGTAVLAVVAIVVTKVRLGLRH